MTRNWNSLLLVVLLGFTSSPLPAFAASWYDDEMPVVISPSRLRQTITDAPTAITVIDRELIELSGARSLADVLLLVPGFQVSRYLNGFPVVTYHGQTTRYNPQLQLIINGRPAYIPLYGGIPWGDLPIALSDIERIEVVRSPNAATFGPNSYFAVISITTISAATDAGWSIQTEAGGNQYGSATVNGSGMIDDLDYRLSLQLAHDEGFSNIPDTERDKRFAFYSTRPLNNRDKIDLDFGFTRSGYMELGNVVTDGDLTPYRDVRNGYVHMGWERTESSDSSDSLDYHYSRFSMDESGEFIYDVGEALQNEEFLGFDLVVPLSRYAVSTRHELEFERTRRLNNVHRVNLGSAIRYDSVAGEYIFNDDSNHEIYTGRVFINSEYSAAPDWIINSGLMFEYNTISKSTLIPRLAAIYKNQPNSSVRLSYSRGERTPLLLETEGEVTTTGTVPAADLTIVSYSVIGNPRLKPETIDVYELGFTKVIPENRFKFDAKISRQIVGRKVVSATVQNDADTFDGRSRVYVNETTKARMSNFELQIESEPGPGSRFRMAYSYSFDFDSLLEYRRLTPRHSLSLFGAFSSASGNTMSAEYFHTSDWIWDDVSDVSRLNRFDLRLARRLGFGKAEGEAFVQAELYPGKNTDYVTRNKVQNRYFAGFSLSWY